MFFTNFVLSSPAWAQNFLNLKTSEIFTTETPVKPLLEIDFTSLAYSSVSEFDHSTQQKAELEFGLTKKGFIFSEVHLIAGSFSEKQSFYFAAPEFYIGIGDKNGNSVAAGRKIESYNFLDSYYNLGLYNSYFTNDFIDYKEQGLTGIHLQMYNGMAGAFVGWQPYYIPSQKPQVQEEDSRLTSTNRWAQRPPPQFQFAEQNRPIQYLIRDYKISEIVNNQGQSAKLFLGRNPMRPLVQIAYAHHPLNEIPLSRDTYGSAIDFVGHVHLSPVVTYQEVKSADINFDYKNIQTSFSYAEDQVENKTVTQNETLQNMRPLKIYGFYAAADLQSLAQRELSVSLAMAEFEGGEIKDLTQDGKESIFTFSSLRTQFKSPTTLGVSGELFWIKSKPLRSEVRWTYDRTFKGSLLSAQLNYETIGNMNIRLGVDLIGVESQLPALAVPSFLDRNQANDRVFGGLHYAF